MSEQDALVVIGNFDGVHRGHQAVLGTVATLCEERGLKPRMLTFDPHPAVTLGRPAPPLLTTLEHKRELIAAACPGIDIIVRAFTPEFAQLSPEAFVRDVLVSELGARFVMVGDNFRFGRGRAGGVPELKALGAEHGFEARAEPLVTDGIGAWSSTRVRGLVTAGDMAGVTEILGRPHALSGTVSQGDQRGRTLGFPTCNLPNVPEVLPPFGVYAVKVDELTDEGPVALAKGVANLGVRPTMKNDPKPLLEAHLFDFEGDLYGRRLRVHLVARIRDEKRFDGLAALEAQIAADSAEARRLLGDA